MIIPRVARNSALTPHRSTPLMVATRTIGQTRAGGGEDEAKGTVEVDINY